MIGWLAYRFADESMRSVQRASRRGKRKRQLARRRRQAQSARAHADAAATSRRRAAAATLGYVPAGWYPDNLAPGQLRWWDGFRWTSHVVPTQP